MAKSHDAQGMSKRPSLNAGGMTKTRPGGPGGNKVAGGSGGAPKSSARPGGPGGQKNVSSAGGPMAPRPGGSQPGSPRRGS